MEGGFEASVAFMRSLEALLGGCIPGVDSGDKAKGHGSGGGDKVEHGVWVHGESQNGLGGAW